jgi:hypothetical protein
MLIAAAKVMNASDVLGHLELLQLWDGDLERREDQAQSRLLALLGSRGDLLQEIPSERVVFLSNRTLGLTDELRDDVQITDTAQEVRDLSELPVHVHLLKKGLAQTGRIFLIGFVWTVQPDLVSL